MIDHGRPDISAGAVAGSGEEALPLSGHSLSVLFALSPTEVGTNPSAAAVPLEVRRCRAPLLLLSRGSMYCPEALEPTVPEISKLADEARIDK